MATKANGKNQSFLQNSLLFLDEYSEQLTKRIAKVTIIAIALKRLLIEKYAINQYNVANIRKENAIVVIASFFILKSETATKIVGSVPNNKLIIEKETVNCCIKLTKPFYLNLYFLIQDVLVLYFLHPQSLFYSAFFLQG